MRGLHQEVGDPCPRGLIKAPVAEPHLPEFLIQLVWSSKVMWMLSLFCLILVLIPWVILVC